MKITVIKKASACAVGRSKKKCSFVWLQADTYMCVCSLKSSLKCHAPSYFEERPVIMFDVGAWRRSSTYLPLFNTEETVRESVLRPKQCGYEEIWKKVGVSGCVCVGECACVCACVLWLYKVKVFGHISVWLGVFKFKSEDISSGERVPRIHICTQHLNKLHLLKSLSEKPEALI